MMFHRPLAAAVSVLALTAAVPALAQQLSAKDAWAQIRSFAAGSGVTITSRSVEDFGSTVSANAVRIFATDDPEAMVVSMDSLRIEPRGDAIALIPSEVISIDTLVAGGTRRAFEIIHNGEIVGAISETEANVELQFGSLIASLVSAERRGAVLDESFQLNLGGLAVALHAEREGDVEMTLTVDSASYAFDINQTAGTTVIDQAATGQMTNTRIEFAATELDTLADEPANVREVFDEGVTARLSMTTGPSTGTSRQVMDGTTIVTSTTAGDSSLSMAFENGRFDTEVLAGAGRIEGSVGPINGNATYESVSFNFGLPLVVTPDEQEARYAFRFVNVTPSPELLTVLGAGQFAGDAVTLALDLNADVRLVSELGPDMDDDTPPFDLSTARLDELTVRVGDSEFTGSGAVTLIGGLLGNIGRSMPEAQGDFVFNLVGGERLLTRIQAMGIVPNDQLFFARMMINGLGRPIGDDLLQSDVAIRPGGVITVNGAPLPF